MKKQFPIEKDIPFFPAGFGYFYPFEKMETGDSFRFVSDIVKKVAPAASSYGKRHNMKFSIRKTDDNSYRCWRIK